MRRMFSENQIKSLVNQGIESGEIQTPPNINDVLDPIKFVKLSFDDEENLIIEIPYFLQISKLSLSSIVLEDDSQGDLDIEFDNTNGYQVSSPYELNSINTDIETKTKSYYIWMKQNVKSLDSVGIDVGQFIISIYENY